MEEDNVISLILRGLALDASPTPVPTTTTTSANQDSVILLNTLKIYGSIYLGSLVSFAILRQKCPRLFNVRSWSSEQTCKLAQTERYNHWNWLVRPFRVSDRDIFDQCGMDALCFIRALQFGRKLAIFGCCNAIWLIPVYYTAQPSKETDYLTDFFQWISISNLSSSSPRYAATVVAAYLTFLYTFYLIFKEYKWYTEWRHTFLKLKAPRNYAVYVSGIPKEYQSSQKLAQYFRQCTSNDAVAEAHIAVDTPLLDFKVSKREMIIRKLEHNQAMEQWKQIQKKNSNNNIESSFTETQQQQQQSRRSMIVNRLPKQLQRTLSREQSQRSLESELDGLNRYIQEAVGKIRGRNGDVRSQLSRNTASRQLNRKLSSSFSLLEEEEEPGKTSQHSSSRDDHRADIHMDTQQQQKQQDPCHDNANDASDGSGTSPYELYSSFSSFEQPSRHRNKKCFSLPLLGRQQAQNKSHPTTSTAVVPAEVTKIEKEGEKDFSMVKDGYIVSNDDKKDLVNPEHPEEEEEKREDGDEQQQPQVAVASKLELNGESFHNPPSEKEDKEEEEKTEETLDRSPLQAKSSDSQKLKPSKLAKAVRKSMAVQALAGGLEATTQTIVDGTRAVTQSAAVKALAGGIEVTSQTIADSTRAASKTIAKSSKIAIDSATDLGRKAQSVGTNVVQSAGSVLPAAFPKIEGAPLDCGFVVFRNLHSTQSALQMIHHSKPYCMEVLPAPEPQAIFWRNVGLPHSARRGGRFASIAASTVLCFFWSVPMAFISSLTEINSLKQSMPRLGEWIENHPAFENFLTLVAPLLLLFFNEVILPSILKYFSRWEGTISSALLEASLFVKMGVFMIIQTFFVSAITGGITGALVNMLEEPENIVTFLANSLSSQSTYFIQITLTQTFVLQSLEMLRVYPLSVAFLRHYLGPNLTEKERRRPWGWIYPLDNPPDFWLAETFAMMVLFYIVFFVYATIAPIVSFFLLFCFLLLESGYRYQFIHNYPRAYDTGGKLWKSFIHFTLASLVIAQLTLIGLLTLKQNPYSAPAIGPLLACTVLFIIFLNSRHSLVSNFLPSRDCILRDSENDAEGPMDMSFAKEKYLQPSLQSRRFKFPEKCSVIIPKKHRKKKHSGKSRWSLPR